MIKSNRVLIVVLFATLLLAALPFMGLNLYLVSFLFLLMMNISLTVGWNIIGGYAGYVSFGHVAFVGVGGYTTAVLLAKFNISPIITTPLAGIIAALVALVVGYPALRLRGPYFSLITLVISLAIAAVILNLPGINASSGIFLTPPSGDIHSSRLILFEMMVIVLLFTILCAYFIERSKFGIGLKAIREDEVVAATQGVNTTNLKLLAFVISGGLAGIVGGVFSWYKGLVFVDAMFSVNISVMIVLMALLGGTHSWIGAVVGSVLVMVINEFLTLSIGSNLSQIIFGILLVVTILFIPNGIVGWIEAQMHKFRKKAKG